jgi:autoinducer 2-degrading protein
MLVVTVDVQVRPEEITSFLTATLANASSSLTEPGVLRFDVIQDNADAAHVVLLEVYRNADAAAAHKQTEHYATWRDAVAPMMARPRSSTACTAVFPPAEQQWATPQ